MNTRVWKKLTEERKISHVEKFLSTKLKVVPGEVCDVYEIALEELA